MSTATTPAERGRWREEVDHADRRRVADRRLACPAVATVRSMNSSVRLAVGLVVLAAIAIGVLTVARVDRRRDVLTAAGRAVVQLTVVALALRGVFAEPVFVVLALAVMFSVATWTAAGRL